MTERTTDQLVAAWDAARSSRMPLAQMPPIARIAFQRDMWEDEATAAAALITHLTDALAHAEQSLACVEGERDAAARLFDETTSLVLAHLDAIDDGTYECTICGAGHDEEHRPGCRIAAAANAIRMHSPRVGLANELIDATTRADAAEATVESLREAVGAVRGLHVDKPYFFMDDDGCRTQGFDRCAACNEVVGSGQVCPTIAALDAALTPKERDA